MQVISQVIVVYVGVTEQLLQPEPEEPSTVNFVLLLRKGNKQQYKNLSVSCDSELALNLKNQEEVGVFS